VREERRRTVSYITLPGDKAWKNLNQGHQDGRISWWNRRLADKSWAEDSMICRVKKGVIFPAVPQKPVIKKDSNVYTLGSCFARRVEEALMAKGINCLSNPVRVWSETCLKMYGELPSDPNEFVHLYNVPSMYYALRWALDPGFPFPKAGLVRLSTGHYRDYHSHDTQRFCDRFKTEEEMLLFHDTAFNQLFKGIAKCQVIIFTLGLIEAWFDHETGFYLNTTVDQQSVERFPGRYTFEVIDHQTNLDYLEKIYALLKQHCPNPFHIFITVSPVPLGATFTERDILVATHFSKSLLRVLAEEWAWRHEEITYFPSYEMALYSPRPEVWAEDQMHVTFECAMHIVDHFLEAHLAEPKRVEEGYQGYDLFHYIDRYYALGQILGSVNIGQLAESDLEALQQQGLCFIGPSLDAVKGRIDRSGLKGAFLPVEKDYKGYDLFQYLSAFYAFSPVVGAIEKLRLTDKKLETLQRERLCFAGESAAEVKRRIDQAGCRGIPTIIEMDYQGYLLCQFLGLFYGFSRTLGSIDLAEMTGAQLAALQRSGDCFPGASVAEIKRAIDEKGHRLVEVADYQGFILCAYQGLFYAFARSVGPLDLADVSVATLTALQQRGDYFWGETEAAVKHFIDRRVRSEGAESRGRSELERGLLSSATP
jgi:hypothetical protein